MITQSFNWDSPPLLTHQGSEIFGFYACKATSKDLDLFMNRALSHHGKSVFIMALGDDTWIYDTSTGQVIETDYSKFDRTQSKKLQEIWYSFLEQVGAREYVQIWQQLYSEKIVARHRKSGYLYNLDPSLEFMLTGEPGTSVRNTVTNIFISALATTQGPKEYEDAGLIVKRKVFKNPSGSTFLRHVAIRHGGTWTFVRTPSFLVKFGKTRKNPKEMYPKTWTIDRCYKQILWSQWLGYGNLQKSNWFYRAIHAKLKRLCNAADEPLFRPYHITSHVEKTIDDEEWNSFMSQRYGITPDDQWAFLKLLEQVQTLPSVLRSPVNDLLCARDY
jgi:hypothetical protein